MSYYSPAAKTNFPLHEYLVPTGNSTRGPGASMEAVQLTQRTPPLRSGSAASGWVAARAGGWGGVRAGPLV